MSIPIDILRQVILHDPQTGRLVWRARPASLFQSGDRTAEHTANIWNTRHAGKLALNGRKPAGYLHGRIMGNDILAHRAMWALCKGSWPQAEIDHINGKRDDNRLANLRLASRVENCRNRQSNNRTGVRQVGSRYQARITLHGRISSLGCFPSEREAKAAYDAASRELFGQFHQSLARQTT